MFKLTEGGVPLQLASPQTLVAGYTGRDEAAVRHHIDELAAIGVPAPERVPMFYPVPEAAYTTAPTVTVGSGTTSGEVEPVIVRHAGRYFLGIGSDHTDREIERRSVADSKTACPKPVGDTLTEVPDWDTFDYDACRMSCRVDGRLYQEGSLRGLRTPANLLAEFAGRGADRGGDLIFLAGTLPLLDGDFVYGRTWELELTLPGGIRLAHAYTVEVS